MLRKLIYLRVNMLKMSFVIGLLNQFMHKVRDVHGKAIPRVLTYINSSYKKELFYTKNRDMFTSLHFQMLDMQRIQVTKSLPIDTLYLLEIICYMNE